MATRSVTRSENTKRASRPAARVSRTRKPEHLTPAEWQTQLRRQFASEQPLQVLGLPGSP